MASSGTMTRRTALGRLGLLMVGAAAAGCTPLRIVFKDYPERFEDEDASDRVLRAFVSAVIPGAHEDDPNLVRVYFDEYYRFARYTGFFAADLTSRAAEIFGAPFESLSTAERSRVIQDGLAADGTTERLYSGAIFLAQLSYYSGIYDSQAGCDLIDFDGAYRFRDPHQNTYPHPDDFLAATATRDGNYA